MILIRFTVILAIIGLMLLLLRKKYNKKITKNIGIGILTVIIIFWIGFFAWALAETSEEYKRQFPDDNTNVELIETNDISNNIIQYTEATSFFQGKISSIKNNTIYFYDSNNQYYYINNDDNTKYIDGRTGEACAFSDIKEGYYISDYLGANSENTYLIYKDIIGEELKKELLISLSLSDDVNIGRTSVLEIKDVEQLGNNEAIVTFEISDIIGSNSFPDVNDSDHNFDVKLKVTNNTKYNTNFHGINAYNAETIENAKNDAMLYLRLNPDTLDDEYPEISEFDSYSN